MVLREQFQRLSLLKLKFGIHCVQAVLTVIAWILTIAVIAKPGGSGSATYWYFFLTWITLIALIYQAFIPIWERTKRFKNIYACFAIDVVFAIFWASAFGAVQAWTASGVPSDSTGYCKGFTYGDDDRCTISFGTVILGVLIFLMFLAAAGISGYKVWYFRKNGYCISQRPSISNPQPIEPKLVYGSPNTSQIPPALKTSELEKGNLTISVDGTHPGRKLSWDVPPLSAPACAPDVPQARPTFRQIDYSTSVPSGNTRTTQYEPFSRRPVPGAVPQIQLHGPTGRAPSVVFDYGATTPYPQQDPYAPPYAPSLRHNSRYFAPSTPAQQPQQQYWRGSIAPAQYTTQVNYNPYMVQDQYLGYRGNNMAGNQDIGYNAYNRRASTLRVTMPGPASTHVGGYQSAYHTPLPSAMMSPNDRNYHTFKRESTVQFYSQQQAFSRP